MSKRSRVIMIAKSKEQAQVINKQKKGNLTKKARNLRVRIATSDTYQMLQCGGSEDPINDS